MQNQPDHPFEYEYAPCDLPREFPLEAGRHSTSDEPITYMHQHNYFEIGYCHYGSGVFAVSDKILPFHTGDVSVISESEMHIARNTRGATAHWTFMSLDPVGLVRTDASERQLLLTAHLAGPEFPNILHADEHPDIVGIIRQIVEEVENMHPGYKSAVRGLVWALMAKLQRLPGAGSPTPKKESLVRIASALTWISGHYMDAMQIEELAEICRCSQTSLRRYFSAAVGYSPQAYLIRFRINMAASLLMSTVMPVTDISYEVGFTTLSNFNRSFKAIMGMSPREWRNK